MRVSGIGCGSIHHRTGHRRRRGARGLISPLSALFKQHEQRPCISQGERRLTYGEVLDLGRALISHLPTARSLVVVRTSLNVEAVAAYLAVLERGHVPLLVEAALSQSLLRTIVDTYRPAALIDAHGAELTKSESPALHPSLGILLTTSGSTGSPKLVRLSLDAVMNNAAAVAEYLNIGPQERPFLHLPISYSYGLSVLHSHILAGAEVCLASHSIVEPEFWNELRCSNATSIAGVPFHYSVMRRFSETLLGIESLRTFTQAGGRLDPKLVAFFAEWAFRNGRKFFVMYGQTEAGPRIAYLPPDRALGAPDAIGIPIPGVRIAIVGEDGRDLPHGSIGELVCLSSGVMMGYANAPEDLAEGDVMQGTLHTGDLAVQGSDGLLRIVGRRSSILKIYGLRINLDEVQLHLRQAGIFAACSGEEDRLQILVQSAETQSVRRLLMQSYSIPSRGFEVRRVATLPVGQTGKISAAAFAEAWRSAQP